MKSLSLRSWAGRSLFTLACSLLAAGCFAAGLQFTEDPGEGDYNVVGSLTVKSPQSLDASLAFSYQDKSKDHYLLTIRGGDVRLNAVRGGKTSQIGTTARIAPKAGETVPFTLQRRAWRIALIWNNTVILRGYDRALGDGKVGTKASGGVWEEVRVQPVGDLEAQDDFVREEGAESIWEPAVGTWEAKTLRDDEQAAREEADKSANAFSYFGAGVPRAITLAGNWFWDRYTLETAVKPTGRGAVGLVFYYQDEENYLVARLGCEADPAPVGNRLQLVAVRGGKEQLLADKPGGYEPRQWYKLRVQVCEDFIQCFLDDDLRLQTHCTAFGQGQIGLYVEGRAGAFFDDVACAEWESYRDGFGVVVPGKWQLGKGFKQANGLMTHTGPRSQCVGGQPWQRYSAGVDATLTGKGSVGLAFCYQSDKDYCLIRAVSLPGATKAQLVRVTDKGQAILAEQPLSPISGRLRLRASVEDGLLTGQVGDGPRLQAMADGVTGGLIALVADGQATFDNVAVALVPVRRGSHVTKEFTVTDKHPEMAGWASTRAPWVPPAEGKDDWWTKGDYFGETTVTFTVPAVGSKTGVLRVVVGGESDPKSGLALTVAATEKSKKLALALLAGDKTLKTGEVEIEGDARFVFSRESSLYIVRVNDATVLTLGR